MANKPIIFDSGDIRTRIEMEQLGEGKTRLHVHKTQDVSGVLAANAEKRNDGSTFGHRSDNQFMDSDHFADIPFTVILEWIAKYRFNILVSPARNGMTPQAFKRKLRSLLNGEYSHLKTYNGRL